MRRSSRLAMGVMGLLAAMLTMLRAEEPAKKAETIKPPWQRLLQGEDARKATEQDRQLAQMQEAGQFSEALKVAEALAELRTKAQGADHWEAVNAKWDVAALRSVVKQEEETRKEYAGTFALAREAASRESKGRFKEVQTLREKLLAIRRKVLGEENPDTADSYNYLALNLHAQGKYQEAEVGYRKALTIWRKVLGEEHPDTARGYNNLAGSLQAQGKYQEAEEGYRKALAIYHRFLGEEHVYLAASYSGLALTLTDLGKYQDAEVGFRKALAICRKVVGENHAYTAKSYGNVAINLQAQGKYKQAEDGFRLALSISRKVLGEEHPDTAQNYNNLAFNMSAQSKYPQAEEGYRKALTIFRKVLGEEHPYTGFSYNNLAKILGIEGKLQEAEENHGKALSISRKLLGEKHPSTATCYNNIAFHLEAQNRYQQAETGFRKALDIWREVLGDEHPSAGTGYTNLAHNLYFQGRYKEAEEYWLLGVNVFAKARLLIAASGLERATKTSERSPLLPLAAVLARNGKPGDAWQRFEESLARGTWDDLSARLRRPQAERNKQKQITARIDRLNKLLERTNLDRSASRQSNQRDELLSQLRQAYQELAAFTQQLEQKYGPVAGQIFSRTQIQASLAADTAFLAWLDLDGHPKAVDSNGDHWAILLRSSGDPIWVAMKGSGDKDTWTDADTRLPNELRATLQSPRGLWQPLAQRLRKQRLDPVAQHLKGVRKLIVLPSMAMAGVPVEVIAEGYTVSYAHSGTMYAHLLRQPAPSGKGLFALADPIFDTPTEKEKQQPLPPNGVLLTMVLPGSDAAKAGLKANDVLLRYGDTDLAAPTDFKPQSESNDVDHRVTVIVWREGKKLSQPLFVRPGKLGVVFAKEPAPQAVAEQRRMNRLLASRSGDEGNWPRLPGTRIEAASLQRLFGSDSSQLLLDSDASEQCLSELAQLGELGTYRYLHFATHGEVNDVFPLRSAVILARDQLPDEKQRTELLLSDKSIPDGRLEAEEALARWNLHCDLVTLSACETALGKYERGEGFVGFAQSLILCGTRSVCLSLWKVDDTATALLMERFYQNLLGKREGLDKPMTKAAALAEAKAWLRDLPREQAIKHAAFLSNGVDRGKRPALPPLEVAPTSAPEATEKNERPFAHPYYWAAFVLVGHAD